MLKHGGRFYISADLEGVAAVIGESGKGLSFDTPGYAFAVKQGTREVNAAVRALFETKAREVWVWDSHGKGYNLDYDALDPRVRIVMGAGSGKRFPLIETGFDGVLFIGYHAYDTPDAVLSHVYSSGTFQHQKVDGKFVGEAQIDGAVAGSFGVPVVFLSSDNICVSQGIESFGDIPSVVTKTALAFNSCVSRHPRAVCDEIAEKVKQSVLFAQTAAPFTFRSPFQYEIRYKRIEYAESCRLRSHDGTRFTRDDAYTVSGYLKDPADIF